MISLASNTSVYPVNTHATWVPAVPAGPALGGRLLASGRRQLDEDPPPGPEAPEGDGLILQVIDQVPHRLCNNTINLLHPPPTGGRCYNADVERVSAD